MRKQLNKIAMIALAGVIGSTGLAAFAGCSDPYANMTQLSIHYFNGGLGSDWINESIAEFEEMFKDVSFESGKTGVKLLLTADKSFDEIATSLSTGADKADILYTAEGNAIVDLLNTDGILYDTTEMATEKVYNADGEVTLNAAGDGFEVVEGGQSMYDRMHPYFRDTYNLAGTEWATNSSEVSFTMLPYEDTLAGIILDYDLYEELYTKYYRAGLIGEMTGYKYEGDSVAMPGTWDEFFDLMTLIRDNESHSAGGYSGFMYSVDYYTPSIENAVIADVDGTDEGVTDPSQYSGIRMYDTYQGTYDFGGELGVQTITKDNADGRSGGAPLRTRQQGRRALRQRHHEQPVLQYGAGKLRHEQDQYDRTPHPRHHGGRLVRKRSPRDLQFDGRGQCGERVRQTQVPHDAHPSRDGRGSRGRQDL